MPKGTLGEDQIVPARASLDSLGEIVEARTGEIAAGFPNGGGQFRSGGIGTRGAGADGRGMNGWHAQIELRGDRVERALQLRHTIAPGVAAFARSQRRHFDRDGAPVQYAAAFAGTHDHGADQAFQEALGDFGRVALHQKRAAHQQGFALPEPHRRFEFGCA